MPENPTLEELKQRVQELEQAEAERIRAQENPHRNTDELAFIGRVTLDLLQFPLAGDMYRFVAERVMELVPGALVSVARIDKETDEIRPMVLLGIGDKLNTLTKMIGIDPRDISFRASEELLGHLSSGKLTAFPGGIFKVTSGRIPRIVSKTVEKLLGFKNIYLMGFNSNERPFGNVVIMPRNGMDLENRSLIEAFIGQATVVIEHRHSEEALRQSEKRLKLAQAIGHVGMWDWDMITGKSIWSDETYRILGFSPGECHPSYNLFLDVVHDDDRNRLNQAVEAAQHQHQPYDLDCRIVRKDGSEVVANARGAVTFDADDKPIRLLGTFQDISERKRAEDEKLKLEERLQQSQKMEAIGRLAGGVAHDFNNILTGINGYAEIAIDDLKPGDPMRADLEEIKSAGMRAADLTKQLLAFSRKQTISPKVVRPNEILERSQKMLRRIIGEDIDLVFIPANNLGRIKADPAQLDQILVNLAVNAREATPNGGKLTIETQNVSIGEEFCASHIEAEPGDYILLAVSDNGQGMDEKTKSNIFEPFFSSKGGDANTGLGLATVYGIVKQNGGFISVYSALDTGTTFNVYFPRVMERADALPEEKPRDLLTGTETLLLVEDEAHVRNLTKKILERKGYKVIAKDNGSAAFAYCDQSDDPIDLLLTDVVMPNMNGRDLFIKLQKKRPELKALFMSGYTENVIAHHGVLYEGVNFIQKPFTLKTLAITVRRVLDTT